MQNSNDPFTKHSPKTENAQRKLGLGMFVIAWLVLLGMLATYFDGWQEQQFNPNKQVASTQADGRRELVLNPNRQHHYVVNGKINGREVTFLLDTGATDVVIPAQLGTKLALTPGAPQWASTANGQITVYRTELDQLHIGDLALYNVSASLNPGMQGEVILLGMSALRQLEFIQQGDTLILRQ